MNEKEFNGLILAELVKIANEVFTNEIEIAPGTYTAAELAKLKDANGNEINIKYLCVDAKLNITDFRAVQINSFKCSFPVDQVFNLVWQFEKLIGTKQANKTRFTKIEERENIVCSFDMWITKEHLNITKLVTKDSLRNDSICPNLKCNIKALDRAKVPTIPEKEPVREPEKHLPALYVDAQTKTPAFVFALVALIDFISRWFYQDQINKALQRLTMLTELSGISLPELLTEPVNEETNANEPEPITENEPVRAYTPELLYIDQPLVFPVPIFIHKHERTISPTVVPELLNRQCITLLFVSMMLPELLRRYVWGAIRPKANADELFWGDFRRFHTKGNHRIRDGTKEANKPKLQPFQTNYYIHQESLWKRINKPKEVIAETNRLRKVRSMLLDWILIWLILSESNRT